jgi:hypothetical protein
MDYWDTSALFKLDFPGTDSDWFIARFAAAGESVVTSEIAVVELYCNLLRNERMGRMASGSAATQFRGFTEYCEGKGRKGVRLNLVSCFWRTAYRRPSQPDPCDRTLAACGPAIHDRSPVRSAIAECVGLGGQSCEP